MVLCAEACMDPGLRRDENGGGWSRRDFHTILPGEELAYDYGEEYFELHLAGICRCSRCSKSQMPTPPMPVTLCCRSSGVRMRS